MMKRKLQLKTLKVQSFVTELEGAPRARGGIVQTEWCSNAAVYCSLNFCVTKEKGCTVTQAPNC